MISILMPIYNGIEFIDESVPSIIAQTYDKWELLIAINGHPQNSEVYKIAKKYEEINNKIRVFDLYNIKGKSNALNASIEYCNYDYVALLDVDDIWHEKKLELQSKYLTEYDVIGSKCIYFGDISGVVVDIPQNNISNFDFALFNPIINSSSIIKKSLSYWKSEYDGVEDYDLWLRLHKSNKTFYNCSEILVKHRIHNNSSFNAQGNNNKVSLLLKNHGLSREEKKEAEKVKKLTAFVIEQNQKSVQIHSKDKIKMSIINY
jgi:glycosyltransferase involved in cell wall biosynthesis